MPCPADRPCLSCREVVCMTCKIISHTLKHKCLEDIRDRCHAGSSEQARRHGTNGTTLNLLRQLRLRTSHSLIQGGVCMYCEYEYVVLQQHWLQARSVAAIYVPWSVLSMPATSSAVPSDLPAFAPCTSTIKYNTGHVRIVIAIVPAERGTKIYAYIG